MKKKMCCRFIILGLLVLSLVVQITIAVAGPSEQEKTYISSAGGYLKTQNEQGMKVATTMNGLNTGTSTLDDVREAIKHARYKRGLAWRLFA
jgi:hypothetical protein